MGIVNATPDSFFSGSRVEVEHQVLALAEKHIQEGAHILDIGGMSSRPGAAFVSAQEEADRVLPAIEAIRRQYPDVVISIDTWRSEIAREAVRQGAGIVNDISAGALDQELFATVAELQVPYILMHMQGTPQTMQADPRYQNVTLDVLDFFIEKLRMLRLLGVKDIWLDPGFGFGKTMAQNYQLLRELNHFQMLGCPIVAGVSRKGMIYKALGVIAEDALNGTTAAHLLALERGARVLRVHDVRAAWECVEVWGHFNGKS
jgi:dihydropteroate synthase